jgi:hypothetical protein
MSEWVNKWYVILKNLTKFHKFEYVEPEMESLRHEN